MTGGFTAGCAAERCKTTTTIGFCTLSAEARAISGLKRASASTDRARSLSPCSDGEDWNKLSHLLAVEFGGRRIFLPGDAEKPAWDSVDSEIKKRKFSRDILKAAITGGKATSGREPPGRRPGGGRASAPPLT
jgi:hypothetical protein